MEANKSNLHPKAKGSEHVARISYLYQAADQVVGVVPSLGQHYGEIMTVVSQKTPAKLDHTIKRTICKNCKQLLILGENATYRLKRRRRRKKGHKPRGHPTQIIRCLTCSTAKSFSTNPTYEVYKKPIKTSPPESDGNCSDKNMQKTDEDDSEKSPEEKLSPME